MIQNDITNINRINFNITDNKTLFDANNKNPEEFNIYIPIDLYKIGQFEKFQEEVKSELNKKFDITFIQELIVTVMCLLIYFLNRDSSKSKRLIYCHKENFQKP